MNYCNKSISFHLYLTALISLLISSSVWGLTPQLKKLTSRCFEAINGNDYQEAYNCFTKAKKEGKDEFSIKQKEAINNVILHSIYRVPEKHVKQGNRAEALEWIEKGLAMAPITYEGAPNIFIPALRMIKGLVYYEQGKYEESQDILMRAQNELSGAGGGNGTELRSVLRKEINKALHALETRVISEGTYVTHKNGMLQKWIGRVVDRKGNLVSVRITYVNPHVKVGFSKGEYVEFLLDQVREVTKVSPDALLRGWK